ncbi:histidyl-tRNA synthetase [Geomicrobium halophilum]|uniref:Histidine--tRNA ligase n=1 Tax=Geomicrobium halophilum TaxID=549000 RepID=A0A841PKV5_9BACL|nr:histidine--tRNA ligase [Geomicrobium halophilum]MBB6449497.1 histidyl-tRNA synthetase [Geomicrobium halophilum]
MNIKIPRGTQDILPEEAAKWQYVEGIARDVSRKYNYKEIRTPIFEATELFQRGVGESTDIVQKEMYTFQDRSGRLITLRPEGTAPVVRSFVENKLHGQPQQPLKLYYLGPMFRYERPESGRMRQFYQFGVEAIGSDDPAIDAEVIAMAMDFYQACGLKNLKLVINSLGDRESRTAHKDALIAHFSPRIDEFCEDCQARLEQNPLRILDCKIDRDHPLQETAPAILDYLNEESTRYFETVQRLLTDMDIPFVIDPNLVRGLDYYTNTSFEIMLEEPEFGSITTLSGGGRYEGLIEELGGPSVSGIGFGLSIERLLMALEARNALPVVEQGLDAFLVTVGDVAAEKGGALLRELRAEGLTADKDYLGKKVKAQFKSADRSNATYTVIIGEEELESGMVKLRDMSSGEEENIPMNKLASHIKQLKKL